MDAAMRNAKGQVDGLGKATKSASNDVATGSGKMKSALGGVNGALGALGLGTVGVAAVATGLINATQSAVNFQDKVSGAASMMGVEYDKLAKKANSFRFIPPNVAAEAFQQLGVVTQLLGQTGDAAFATSGDLLKVAQAMTVVTGIPIEEITNGIAAAFRGEYDSLQRLIPNITAAAVETRALADTGKTSAKQLTEQEKAQAVFNMVMEAGTRYLKDQSANTDTAAAKQKELAASFERAKNALGNAFMPLLDASIPLLIARAEAATDFINALRGAWNWMEKMRANPAGALFNAVMPGSGFFVGRRQGGGPVAAGQTYLVGEDGPELFQADRSGSIVPNHRLGGGGRAAANVTNVTVIVQGSVTSERDLVDSIHSGLLRKQGRTGNLGIKAA